MKKNIDILAGYYIENNCFNCDRNTTCKLLEALKDECYEDYDDDTTTTTNTKTETETLTHHQHLTQPLKH